MYDLKGRSVLITGGARRIGRGLALAFADAGANVAITYLTSNDEAQSAMTALKQKSGRALAVPCDVRDAVSVQGAVHHVVKEFGGLDVLVNNAAVYETVGFEQITVEQWDRMLDTNTRGPFLMTQAAAPALRERHGHVVNIGSLGGLRPWATHAHYCASKAALVMLTQTMAKALAPEVAVNCVAPGMIMSGDTEPDELYHKIIRKTPMKRAGTPNDVAQAVLFFACATHFITGQTMVVDGGLGMD
jgi:NAD(P)-dependent dehydrogenase (short-subunit alcohol dehydrogenase family)